jgi:hypothetical protein
MVTNKERGNYGINKTKLRESYSQLFVSGLLRPLIFRQFPRIFPLLLGKYEW